MKRFRLLFVAGAVVALGAFFACLALFSSPLMHRWRHVESEVAVLREKVGTAEDVLARRDEVEQDARKIAAFLFRPHEDWVAPREDPFAWASVIAQRCARQAGIEISSQAEVGNDPPPWHEYEGVQRSLVPYRVRFELTGGLPEARRFIERLESENPLLSMASISVLGDAYGRKREQVICIVEWPMWKDVATARRVRTAILSQL